MGGMAKQTEKFFVNPAHQYLAAAVARFPSGCRQPELFATDLPNIHFAKPKTLQHPGDRASRVVRSDLEDAILQRGLLQLAFSFFADFALEVGIWGRE
jgi:hypothetical protein